MGHIVEMLKAIAIYEMKLFYKPWLWETPGTTELWSSYAWKDKLHSSDSHIALNSQPVGLTLAPVSAGWPIQGLLRGRPVVSWILVFCIIQLFFVLFLKYISPLVSESCLPPKCFCICVLPFSGNCYMVALHVWLCLMVLCPLLINNRLLWL